MAIRVLKFGGTSVADADAIERVLEIAKNTKSSAVIVVSACSQVTNKLSSIINYLENSNLSYQQLVNSIKEQHLQTAKKLGLSNSTNNFIEAEITRLNELCNALIILGEVPDKFKDEILSLGERLSSKIIANALKNIVSNAKHMNACKLIVTDSRHTRALVDFDKTQINIEKNLAPLMRNNSKVVVGGFISADEDGSITTLGRGGSDYSAAVIGNCLEAEAIEIWTDVDGILTSDPTKVSGTELISQLSFQEAAELAYFGAKVLHPKTLGPASRKNIPVFVKNTFKPETAGTKIRDAIRTQQAIKSIASRNNITVINIHSNHMYGAFGFLRRVFEVFDKHQCSVDVVTTSEVSVSITIEDTSRLKFLIEDLNKFSNTEVKSDRAIIAVVGDGLKQTTGIAASLFSAIKDVNISMISLGASEVNLTLVVDEKDEKEVIQKLHNSFF